MNYLPKLLAHYQGRVSQGTLKLLKTALPNSQFTMLVSEKEFWDAQTTLDELAHAKYFSSDAAGEENWPSALKQHKQTGALMSALGGLLNYLRSVMLLLNVFFA